MKKSYSFLITAQTSAGKFNSFYSYGLISNIHVWYLARITNSRKADYFKRELPAYQKAWRTFTMGIAFDDNLPPEIPLHHQIHLSEKDRTEGLYSDSIFVSLSHPEDSVRSHHGKRTMNVSTHVLPDIWFELNGRNDRAKKQVQEQIIDILVESIPGFLKSDIEVAFSSTPVTSNKWVYRKKRRIGGIPQQMDRSLLNWLPNKTPFNRLYLVGDRVLPRQGIPGVTLAESTYITDSINILNQIRFVEFSRQ